jgi:outer membrane protein assembly factor BamD
MRQVLWCLLAVATLACSKKQPNLAVLPPGAPAVSGASIDSQWAKAELAFRRGWWHEAQVTLERLNLEMKPADPRYPRLHFMMGEVLAVQGSELQAVREFRRVSDETPSDPLAPQALLRAGDAYAKLWRKPQLDPTYGQTALSTFQELVSRYPGTRAAQQGQVRLNELQDDFAYKGYRTGLYYYRIKAYDSSILYLRDVVATYPRATIAPAALVQLVKAYQALDYEEDVKETCGYIRRFHSGTHDINKVCPVPRDSTGKS